MMLEKQTPNLIIPVIRGKIIMNALSLLSNLFARFFTAKTQTRVANKSKGVQRPIDNKFLVNVFDSNNVFDESPTNVEISSPITPTNNVEIEAISK